MHACKHFRVSRWQCGACHTACGPKCAKCGQGMTSWVEASGLKYHKEFFSKVPLRVTPCMSMLTHRTHTRTLTGTCIPALEQLDTEADQARADARHV